MATNLRGTAARKFAKAAESPQPNPKAEESLRRGRELMREFERNGFVRLKPRGGWRKPGA